MLMQFEKSPKSKITKSLLEDQALFHSVLSMLDVTSSVVKGRIYLFVYYLFYDPGQWVGDRV